MWPRISAAIHHDSPALIEGLPTQAVIGDKGDDAEALVAYIQARGTEAVIPPRSNRPEHRA